MAYIRKWTRCHQPIDGSSDYGGACQKLTKRESGLCLLHEAEMLKEELVKEQKIVDLVLVEISDFLREQGLGTRVLDGAIYQARDRQAQRKKLSAR